MVNIFTSNWIANNCSKLIGDQFANRLVDNPSCKCGYPVENFVHCQFYNNIRPMPLHTLGDNCTIHTIMFGDLHLTLEENENIFKAIQNLLRCPNVSINNY